MRKYTNKNLEMIRKLMEHSNAGPVMQAFILQALISHAEKMLKATDEQLGGDRGLVSPTVWRTCAGEVQKAMDERLDEANSNHQKMTTSGVAH